MRRSVRMAESEVRFPGATREATSHRAVSKSQDHKIYAFSCSSPEQHGRSTVRVLISLVRSLGRIQRLTRRGNLLSRFVKCSNYFCQTKTREFQHEAGAT